MPGGALMQLVAFGAQDVYLSGQPKVTFFQSTYKRHTNFAMETVQQTVNGAGGNGGLFSVILSRSGDLVGDMFAALTPVITSANQLTSNNVTYDMCWVAERAFDNIQLFIGGQLIDKHYQLWFRLYSEVFMDDTKKMQYGRMTSAPVALNSTSVSSPSKVYLPLIFFFNRNPGLYLPLIALQYHEVRLDFQLTSYFSSYFGTNPIEVWANYMYLEEAERSRFSKNNHEYLIEQVQHVAGDPVTGTNENSPAVIRLQYNHPVKELIWCYQNQNPTVNLNAMWNFTSSVSNVNMTVDPSKLAGSLAPFAPNHVGAPVLFVQGPFASNLYVTATTGSGVVSGSTIVSGSSIAVQSNVITGNVFWIESGLANTGVSNTAFGYEVGPLHKAKFLLNGTERAVEQSGKYFNQYQTYRYHAGNPSPGIYVYSFALKPEEHQPSGACNFSRIDIAQIAASLKTGMPGNLLQKMFAVNYNILRIASGLGGLAFSN
jgi:hypothetical protein